MFIELLKVDFYTVVLNSVFQSYILISFRNPFLIYNFKVCTSTDIDVYPEEEENTQCLKYDFNMYFHLFNVVGCSRMIYQKHTQNYFSALKKKNWLCCQNYAKHAKLLEKTMSKYT